MKEITLPGDMVSHPDWLNDDQAALIAPDPAHLVIAAYIIQRVRDSVSEFQKMFLDLDPEFQIVFDQVLLSLAKAGVIKVIGDRIFVLRPNPLLVPEGTKLRTVVSKLISAVANRLGILQESNETQLGDELLWQCLPDHPKVRRRLNELNNRYIRELLALQREVSEDAQVQAEGVLINVMICGNLKPEDY